MAVDASMRTPGKSVSFEEDSTVTRRRSNGETKPWQVQHYVKSPHTKELYTKGRAKYKELIMTRDAWPTQDSRARFGKQAWDHVVKENPELYANCTCFFYVSLFLQLTLLI
jgi:hypothetical protein